MHFQDIVGRVGIECREPEQDVFLLRAVALRHKDYISHRP